MYCWMVTHSSAYSWLDTKSVQVEFPSVSFILFYFMFLNLFFAFQLSVCVVCVFPCGF